MRQIKQTTIKQDLKRLVVALLCCVAVLALWFGFRLSAESQTSIHFAPQPTHAVSDCGDISAGFFDSPISNDYFIIHDWGIGYRPAGSVIIAAPPSGFDTWGLWFDLEATHYLSEVHFLVALSGKVTFGCCCILEFSDTMIPCCCGIHLLHGGDRHLFFFSLSPLFWEETLFLIEGEFYTAWFRLTSWNGNTGALQTSETVQFSFRYEPAPQSELRVTFMVNGEVFHYVYVPPGTLLV